MKMAHVEGTLMINIWKPRARVRIIHKAGVLLKSRTDAAELPRSAVDRISRIHKIRLAAFVCDVP